LDSSFIAQLLLRKDFTPKTMISLCCCSSLSLACSLHKH